jgi:electron transport complex protein RnfB
MPEPTGQPASRRGLLAAAARGGALLGLGGLAGAVFGAWGRSATDSSPSTEGTEVAPHPRDDHVWQIDPLKCIACGRCATECVLNPSAVKCVHSFQMCGYCELCTGYFLPEPLALNEGAENQLCPTNAIIRKFIEEPYFEYHIDEPLCIGCGRCVKGCNAFGNGSLYLQIRHDLCVDCNECAIAQACPSEAISRVPADQPYQLKGRDTEAGHG